MHTHQQLQFNEPIIQHSLWTVTAKFLFTSQEPSLMLKQKQ